MQRITIRYLLLEVFFLFFIVKTFLYTYNNYFS
nr:MAG TPA: hypothetical protein [Caudoviricetes sp.]